MLRATAILVGLFSSPLALAAEPFFPISEPVQPLRQVLIIAHRGLQAVAPESTAEAVLACGFEIIEWAEVDVRRGGFLSDRFRVVAPSESGSSQMPWGHSNWSSSIVKRSAGASM